LRDAANAAHIWWGVSVENRKHGLKRVDKLRSAKPTVAFLSVEPLLEDLGKFDLRGIHWVIVGGESGAGARLMSPEWARNVRDQCRKANVPFFFKQWGGVRKSETGRRLDGRTYDEFPEREVIALPDDEHRMLALRELEVSARAGSWAKNGESLYDGREQTLVKHYILRNYLLRLALIVGPWCKTINYIDCFSGPWNVRGENYEDSSFGIATKELRKAREKLAERAFHLDLRCFFLEYDPAAYRRLTEFARTITDIEIETKNKRLEEAVGDILSFHRQAGTAFPFVFIDPTGWTGFPLAVIRPLLQLKPGEVLINYMTWHARRFIEAEQERETLTPFMVTRPGARNRPDFTALVRPRPGQSLPGSISPSKHVVRLIPAPALGATGIFWITFRIRGRWPRLYFRLPRWGGST
jgi:three-Cys-motif partner protein